jgi:hypothetical protein
VNTPSGKTRHAPGLWVVAALILAFGLGAAPCVHAQYFALGKGSYPLQFYEIDFQDLSDPGNRHSALDDIHYIPLWASDAFLSLGGEVREQFWNQHDESHGLRAPIDDSYGLQRVVADAYWHVNENVALFGQVERADAFDKKNPSTTDQTRGRLQQGFLNLTGAIGPLDVYARLGRQEISLGSGRFVWINDSSNVRTTHDGVRVHADYQGATLDVIASRPVTPIYTAFDDFSSHAGRFAALYASEPWLSNQVHTDQYYYYRRVPQTQFASLTGNDERHTLGGRIWGQVGGFRFDSDLAYQWGTFEIAPRSRSISAIGTSTRVLYEFAAVALRPAVQFQTSYFSGSDDPKQGNRIGTFGAPFPRPTLLNYAGLETLENLIEAYPAVLFSPLDRLTLRFGPEALWRANVNDAVYVSRTSPLTKTLNDKARYVGTNLIGTAQWTLSQNVALFAEYVHELAGAAITRAGGHGADVGIIQVDFNF